MGNVSGSGGINIIPGSSGGGGGTGNILSINGNTAAAQVIAGGTDISVSSSGGTTTIDSTSQWKDPVATNAALPLIGNTAGDARVVIDEAVAYVWSGTAWNLGPNVNNTDSISMTFSGGALESSLRLSTNAASAGFKKVNLNIESTSSVGLRAQLAINEGTATLVAGTVTVSNSVVTSTSIIFLTAQSVGGIQGLLSVGTIVDNTSFVINSTSDVDTSVIGWRFT